MDLVYEFPATELRFCLPESWVRALPDDGEVKLYLHAAMRQAVGKLGKIAQAEDAMNTLKISSRCSTFITDVDAGTGTITVELQFAEARCFTRRCLRKTGLRSGRALISMDILTELSFRAEGVCPASKGAMEQERDRARDVMPDESTHLDKPEIIRREVATPCVCAPRTLHSPSCGEY